MARRSDMTPDEDVAIHHLAQREATRAFRDSLGAIEFDRIRQSVGTTCLSKAIASAVKAHDRTYIKAIKALGLVRPELVPGGDS